MDEDHEELAKCLFATLTAMLEDAAEPAIAGQSAQLDPEQIVETGRRLQAAALESHRCEAANIVANPGVNRRQSPRKSGR